MKRRYPLFWKICPAFLLIVLLPLIVFSRYSGYSMRRFYIEQMSINLEARANLLKEQMTNYLLAGDNQNIDLFCKRAGKPSGTRITVMLLSGKVLGDSENVPGGSSSGKGSSFVIQILFQASFQLIAFFINFS